MFYFRKERDQLQQQQRESIAEFQALNEKLVVQEELIIQQQREITDKNNKIAELDTQQSTILQ